MLRTFENNTGIVQLIDARSQATEEILDIFHWGLHSRLFGHSDRQICGQSLTILSHKVFENPVVNKFKIKLQINGTFSVRSRLLIIYL